MQIDKSSSNINKGLALLFPLSIAVTVFGLIPFPATSISIYAVLQTGILFLIIISIFLIGDIKLNLNNTTLFFALGFLFFSTLSTLFSSNIEISSSKLLRLSRYILMALIIFLFLKKFWHMDYMYILMKIVSFAIVIAAFTVITDYLRWTNISEYWRHYGMLGGPNIAAGQLSMFFPFVLYLYSKSRREERLSANFAYTAFISVILIAVLLSGSRSGYIMVTITLIAVLAKGWRKLLSLKLALVLLLISLILITVLLRVWYRLYDPLEFLIVRRIQGLTAFFNPSYETRYLPTGSLEKRAEMLKVAWAMFLDNPVLGSGLGTFPYERRNYTFLQLRVHNTFIEVLAETGLLGFMFFFATFALAGANIHKFWKSTKNDIYFYLGLSFLAWTVLLSTQSLQFRGWYFWGMFIPLSMYMDWLK